MAIAEDRKQFGEAMDRIGLGVARGGIANTLDEAIALLDVTGFPAIVRPSFTLGGTGGGIAYNREEFEEIVRRGLSVRAAEQRAKWSGARQRPRTRAAPVDPALAERVRNALEQLTGWHARVLPGRVELTYADEHDLVELAEAFENAAATIDHRAGD